MSTTDSHQPPADSATETLSWSRVAAALPLLIGHRGASALEPENSLAAFARARVDGADGVELDVLRCATGEVVVFHDDDLARLGGGRPGRIAELSLAELRTIRLDSGATIPTLDEVFEACGDAMLINVELKAAGIPGVEIRALVAAVDTAVKRAGAGLAERIVVSSFNPRALRTWRRRQSSVRSGLLFERQSALPLRRAWALPWLGVFSVHPEGVLCTPAAMRGWHRRGYRVNVWTVDDAAELRRFAAMGVDGIITNHPGRARQILAAAAALSK